VGRPTVLKPESRIFLPPPEGSVRENDVHEVVKGDAWRTNTPAAQHGITI